MSGMLGTGLPIAAEAFDLEVYQLPCTFAASQELVRLSREHPGLVRVCNIFQQSEASRRLISLAAMIRSAMDTWSATAAQHVDTPIGDFQSNTAGTEIVPLGFREACNKILHADDIELSNPEPENNFNVLNYDVVLTGTRQGKDWRATLTIPKFLEVASRIA